MYDTARVALKELTDDRQFEQVAVAVLSALRFPGLRITGPSGDEGKDAFDRELFHGKDRVTLMISLEEKWSPKLKSELDKIEKRAENTRPTKAIFVTNRSASLRWQTPHKTRAKSLGTDLEVFDLNELVQSFERDDVRPIAEAMLGVRPTAPRPLTPAELFLERLGKSIPGMTAPLIGRDIEMLQLKNLLSNTAADAPRLVVVDGPGGTGKTRLAVQAASGLCTTLVVPAGVRLRAEAMSMVPLNAPTVLVVDDANRCPDMSGIAALFADDRYDGVKVVLTCRQATTGSVLYRSGIEALDRRDMTLGAEAILARRGRVLDAVLDWITATATPSASTTGAAYDLLAWARVSVAALQAFLSPTIEAFLGGFSDGNQVVTIQTSVLPDDPRLTNTIDAAAAGINDVVLRTDVTVTNRPGATLIRKLIDLPHELRATGRRGLPGVGGPLPRHAIQLLYSAATTIEGGVAARWAELPLAARHHAARQCVQRRGAMGTYRSLAQRAAAGDVLAELTVRDDELTPVLTLVPVDVNDHAYGTATWTRSERRRRRAAEALAEATSWPDGLALLLSTASLKDGICTPPRIAFARRLTKDLDAASADALLTTLANRQDALPYEAELIRQLLDARPAEVLAALKRGATSIRGGEILLSAFQDADDAEKAEIAALLLHLIQSPSSADPEPTPWQRLLSNQVAINATVQRLATGLTVRTAPILDVGSRGLRRLFRSAPAMPSVVTGLVSRVFQPTPSSRDDQGPSPSELGDDAPGEARRARLASAFAFEAFRSTWPGRVDVLIDIGLVSPPAVLTDVLRYFAANEGKQARGAPPFTNDQWIRAVALVERRFDQAAEHRTMLGEDYETGRMIRGLALNVPAELARVVADRLTRPEAAGLRRSSTWRSFFAKTTVEQRTPFALALTRELAALARTLESYHQFDLDQTVAAICAGTAGWDVTLLDLATGPDADKAKAVASVAQLWREPEWGRVVSTLLQSGLTSDQAAILINGIDMTSFGYDDDGARIEQRRNALATLQPADDPAIHAFVAQANERIDSSIASFRRYR